MIEPLCDLVLLSWDHLECTRPCVESILAHTSLPARLIIVDQHSNAETQSYLRSLKSTAGVQVEAVFNPANIGYPKGMNIGLRRATAPFVCFLNNDILVPPGWLEEMIGVMEADPSVGTVCPASNTFDLHPPSGGDWLSCAASRAGGRGRWTEIPYGEGFCLLARTNLMRKIGGFEESYYDQIYFEDADLGRKIQAEGLRCAMAEGTYVWHHGGKTMADHPDRQRLFEENRRRFHARWGPEGRNVLFAIAGPSPELHRDLMEEARKEANRSGKVWVLLGGAALENTAGHLNISIERHPGWQIPWRALGLALLKKKKPEAIFSDSAGLRGILRLLGVECLPSGPVAQ